MAEPGQATASLGSQRWALTLYVRAASARSTEAIATVRQICAVDLGGDVDLTVLHAADHPQRVLDDQVVVLPTLVKHSPGPARQLLGDLSDVERVRVGLELAAVPAKST